MPRRLLLVAGTRPNFMKVASLLRAARDRDGISTELVHTGQHSDPMMSDVFFQDLELPRPDRFLGIGGGSHAETTGRIMMALEPVLLESRPDVVVVVGDVNSTLAAALTAAKLRIPVAHVEAGLRSFDWTMPEEINRVLTDRVSDYLFVTEPSGVENLEREGIGGEEVHLVGNTMVDTLLAMLPKAKARNVLDELSLEPKSYALLTLHRPSNVDDGGSLRRTMANISEAAKLLPVVFPVHPRTRRAMDDHGGIGELNGIRLLPPLGYLDFLKLMSEARVVMTDSGGIQEETTVLGIPCLTLRDNTERPITTESGTNRIVGNEGKSLMKTLHASLSEGDRKPKIPPMWDGQAGIRILESL